MKNLHCFPLLFLLFVAPLQSPAQPYVFDTIEINQAAIDRLSQALRFRTISNEDSTKFDYQEFEQFRRFLASNYPAVHSQLDLQLINGHSMLFKWEGTDPGLRPILFYAHYDVVPVDEETREEWKYPPFDGHVAEGAVWGRGALDDKGRVMALMEATEYLLHQEFQPTRTMYFAFGHDEEVNGWMGAAKITDHFEGQGIRMEAIFDEGGSVMEGIIDEIDKQLAFISIAEKGSLNLRLSVREAGGHSSVPPFNTSIGILGKAIAQLEENPMPSRLTPAVMQLLHATAPQMGRKRRFAIRHAWLFNRMIRNELAEERTTDALIRTKYSVNVINGGVKANVLPQKAEAIVNVRVLQGDSVASILKHFHKVIDDDRVQVSIIGNYVPPSEVTPTNTHAYRVLGQTVNDLYPEALLVPTLMPGSTDSKHLDRLSSHVYRFAPLLISGEEEALSIHGSNERIDIDNWGKMINFYYRLIVRMTRNNEFLTDD